ncbi:MAG: histidine kinase [Planctomycetaceae bacterium]|nr:histidine kinase [Planctomycetaceae bacterium]
MSSAALLVIQGVDQGTRFELTDKSLGIGRGIMNEIRILDTEVSRVHATIRFKDGGYVVSDRNSSNGTFVNSKAIRSHRLASGDQIQLGRSTILFTDVVSAEDSRFVADMVNLIGQPAADPKEVTGSDSSSVEGPDVVRQTVDAREPELAQTMANLQVLYRISEVAVSPSISLDQLLNRILDLTIEVIGADRGCVLTADGMTGELTPQVFRDQARDESQQMPVSRSIVDYVLKTGQGVCTSDARTDDRFKAGQSILQAGIREAICVPMRGRYELMGVVYLDTTTKADDAVIQNKPPQKFNEEKLRLLVAIGRQAALAIEDHRFQEAYVKAERLAAVGQTIATLSHHIKNILQGVRGGSYLVDMGLKDHSEDVIQKGWDIVEKNQEKIYHLVMDMLTFSTERQPALQLANLNDTVGEVGELMQARALECSVALEIDLNQTVPLTTFDPDGIHRAILNIVSNAIDAVEGQPDGEVSMTTGYDANNDEVFIEVTDNGPGIPQDQLERIFNLFESTKGARGTGIGLAVSQKIIREQGGEVVVESSPGNGCCFRLAWPHVVDQLNESTRSGNETISEDLDGFGE